MQLRGVWPETKSFADTMTDLANGEQRRLTLRECMRSLGLGCPHMPYDIFLMAWLIKFLYCRLHLYSAC